MVRWPPPVSDIILKFQFTYPYSTRHPAFNVSGDPEERKCTQNCCNLPFNTKIHSILIFLSIFWELFLLQMQSLIFNFLHLTKSWDMADLLNCFCFIFYSQVSCFVGLYWWKINMDVSVHWFWATPPISNKYWHTLRSLQSPLQFLQSSPAFQPRLTSTPTSIFGILLF